MDKGKEYKSAERKASGNMLGVAESKMVFQGFVMPILWGTFYWRMMRVQISTGRSGWRPIGRVWCKGQANLVLVLCIQYLNISQ